MRFIRQFGQPRPDNPNPKTSFKDWLTLAPTLVALAAVFAQMLSNSQNQKLQYQQLENQFRLKEYELSFKPKQEAYTAFMDATNQLCNSKSKEEAELFSNKVQYASYGIEPFLDTDARRSVKSHIEQMRKSRRGEAVYRTKTEDNRND